MDFDFNQELILENERVCMRSIQGVDLENLYDIATKDEDLVKYSPYKIHRTEFLNEFINTAIRERKNKNRYAFVIYDKLFNEYAGSTSIAAVSNADRRFEIGWTWLGKKFQNTGLNKNCKFLLLQFGFEKLQFERVEFKADERNTVSRRAIESIGGKPEGVLRSHMQMNNDYRRNSVYYSILHSEWPTVKEKLIEKITSESGGKVTKEKAPFYTWGKNCDSWKLCDLKGLSVKLEQMPAGSEEQSHVHFKSTQFFYILTGQAAFQLGDDSYELSEGEGMLVPPGIKHSIANTTPRALQFLVVSLPRISEDRYNFAKAV